MLKTIRFKMVVLWGMRFLLFISCCIFATAKGEVDVADEPYFTDDFILVTEMRGRRVHQVSLDGRTVQLPIPSLNPMAATYDPYIYKVFWVSQGDRRVMSSYLNGTELRLIKKLTAAQSVEGIAIDPYEMFIFYTDGGANAINLVTYDGKKHLRIVMNAKNPRAIETDRKNKKIYWTDWGLETIETTDYDGANRKVVITRKGSWMNGLALDIKGNKMYWTDAKADRLEMADMDGTNLKTLLRHNETLVYINGTAVVGQGEAHYFGVAVDEQNIYFSDWHRKGIYQIPITTTGTAYEYTRLDQNLTREVNGISIYKSSNYYQAPKSPCENHDCSDLCIPLKNDYRCACPDLHRFMPDSNRTCSPGIKANGPDVIWLEHDGRLSGWVRGVKGQPSVYLRAKSIRTWSIRSPAWHWTAVDLNYNDSLLYVYDRYDRYFVQLSLNGSLKIKIINHGSSSQVNGLAYDWLSHNLYWTDSLYNWIQVMKPGTNYTKTLIESSLDRPHGIAVYPQKGLMFWTDWGENQKIQQANMDGTNVVELVNTLLNKPMGITIDYTNNKLFWTNTHVIESYDLVTKARTQYGRRSQNTFMDVAVYKNFMFATDQGVSLTIGRSRPQLWFFDLKDVGGRGMRLPLSRKPYGITMYAASRQKQDTTAPCSVNPCQHLCVPVPSPHGAKRQCLCQDGYKTFNNGRTCRSTLTSKGAMYVYALYDRICAMPFKSTMKKTLKEDANTFCFFNSTKKQYRFRTVDFNYNEGEIYFSESGSSVKTIRRARLEQKGVNSVLVYGTGDVRGLAVDWMTSNMYWTDAEANAIWVSRLEGQYMRKLITDVHNPGAIALDMQTKRLFWTESLGHLSRIMVARLDGTHQTTFVRNTSVISNSTFTSLAVDYVAQRIYWVNPSRNQIWSASLINGSEHRIQALGPRSGNIYGVTVMQDFVGFTEKSSRSSIHVVEKESGKEVNRRGIRHLNQTTVYDIVAYYSGNQQLYLGNANSSCNVANGGCKQLCFPMSSGHKCGCTDSMKISQDGVSCEPSTTPLNDKFFLIADDYRHQIYQSDENLENIRALKFPPIDRPIGLTYDFVSDRVFWTDFHSHVVKSMYLNGSYVKLLFGEGTRSRTEGLAFDPASQLLYYTDSVRSTIAVMNPSGRYHKVLVKGISSPRAIVLDPANGYMYVTSRKTNRGRIIRYQMDGKNETVLVASGLSRPNGLDIDFKNKKMYWCDADTELVGSADIDGNNSRRMFKAHNKADPFDVAVHGDYIYWTDWALKGLFRVSLADRNLTKLRTDLFSGLNDIKYFSRADRSVSTACSVNNGHCSHFCIPLPGNSRTCECPDRFGRQTQAADGKNCPGVTACPRIENVDDTCSLRRGVMCGVKCPNDYHPTVQNITCLNGGVWNADVNSLCAENKKCPLLQIPRNVNIDCQGSRTRGDVCTYTCFANSTYVSGDRNRRCNDSFFWTGKPLICKTKMCPDGIDNGQFYARCFRYVGKTCQYTCNPSYKKISSDPVMCQMNETWSSDVKKLCQKKVCPAVISNGKFEDSCHHYVGDQCQYSCNPGYKKTSSVILKCQMNQTWNADVKTLCERKTCPDGITNGKFADNCKRYAGNECQYSCNAGYKKAIDVTLKCQMNQAWNADVKTLCEQLTCPVLPVPKNSILICKQPVHIGGECSFACKPDTDHVNGSLQRKCMIDLSWRGTAIVCNPHCKPLETPKNAKVQPAACNQTLQKINTVCIFSCVDGSGYVSGNNTRTCLSSLVWSGDPLVCAVSGSGHTAKATGHHGGNVGVTVGIVIIVLLIIAVVVVGLFFVWRRRQHKTRTEYRESSPNSNDTTRYDVGHGSVNLDGSVAFDNPVYGTLPGSQPEGATIGAGDVGIEVVTTPEQTACENPLFDLKDNATTDKKVLLDDVGSSNHDTAA